ncbi:MAG: hypothetical protein JXM79_25385 [Sedimentisphaerales bacterium]|nr:hypothetical protein [Sedimentisphaerales bacterium]
MSEIEHTPGVYSETYQNPDACKELMDSLLNAGMMPTILEACAEWIADKHHPLPLAPDDGTEEQVRRCWLFAAAPDLLAACKKMKAMYAFYATSRTEKKIVEEAEDAILKTHPR